MPKIVEAWRELDRASKAVIATATALAVGVVGFSSKVIYDSYQPSEVVTATDNCPRLDKPELERRKQVVLQAANRGSVSIPWAENENILLALGGKHGMRFVNTEGIVDQISRAKSIDRVMAITDQTTTNYFGFRTTATVNLNNPEQTRTDASQLLSILDTTPVNLIEAIGLDEVKLGDPEPGTIPVYDGFAAAFTRRTFSDNERRVITIGPGHVGSFNHEGGHQVQWRESTRRCGNAYIPQTIDPDFTAANPAGFAYQYPAQNWNGVTRDWYPATGLQEDQADIHDALRTPDAGCEAAKSPIIAHKIGAVSMHLDTLSPNLGAYSLDAFVHYCTTNVSNHYK